MNLQNFITSDNITQLEYVLRQADYRVHIRPVTNSQGLFSFRIHDAANNITGQSRDFMDKAERDKELNSFITYVEVEIHGRLQMELFQ